MIGLLEFWPAFAGFVAALAAGIPAGARWLRVAQREHYIPGWTTRLAALWYARRPVSIPVAAGVLVLAAAAAAAPFPPLADAAPWLAWAGVAAAALAALLPVGLRMRGTSSKLAFTPRCIRLAVAWGGLMVVLGAGLALVLGAGGGAIAIVAAPLVMDLALAIMRPIERAGQRRFLDQARTRLAQVRPRIVAITGSYGKTSTKNHVAQALEGSYAVVASPASFNNLMGLSRAVNERVVPGTEVFVAEMGVYGEGEIRELSKSFPPDVAAITTIGEAHLQRMGSREVIVRAKSEIVERAGTVVLPIDEPELAALAERCRAEGKRVVTVSVRGADADVVLDADAGRVRAGGADAELAVPATAHAVNVAVTVGIALAFEVPLEIAAARLRELRAAPHRAEVQTAAGPGGSSIRVIDDTYNANPVGAAAAVRAGAALAAAQGGEFVVVTPGMIELGPLQEQRNREFGALVAESGGHLIVVGRTNRRALLEGAKGAQHPPIAVERLRDAAAIAPEIAGERGVILYENDVPDHYP